MSGSIKSSNSSSSDSSSRVAIEVEVVEVVGAMVSRVVIEAAVIVEVG